MKRIVFICDLEEGHFFPTFALAHELERRGHEILYMSVLDNQEVIEKQGFRFHCLLDQLYPKGAKEISKRNQLKMVTERERQELAAYIEYLISGKTYGGLVRETKPDIVLISFYLPFDIMILYYKYGIRPVLVGPILREPDQPFSHLLKGNLGLLDGGARFTFLDFASRLGDEFNSLNGLTAPLDSLHEIIFCPGELDFDSPIKAANVHYIGPSLRSADPDFDVYERYNIPRTRKIVYSSMGSQAIRHGDSCKLFFGKMINIMRQMDPDELHLIVCTGVEFDQANLGPMPDNVTVLGWGPQIEILRQTSVALIHGGLGGIKECIYHGVPMIIFAQGFDQPRNGERIIYHGLGFAGDIATISEHELISYVREALTNDTIKANLQKMKKIFREREEQQVGADLIESMLYGL